MNKIVQKLLSSTRLRSSGIRSLLPQLVVATVFVTVGPAGAEIENTVTATGNFGAAPVTDMDTEQVDVEDAAPSLSVSKTSDVSLVSAAGDLITYSVRVENDGNVTITSISVADTLVPLVCPTSGTNAIASLAPGSSETCTASYTALQADFDLRGANDGGSEDNDIDNQATATGVFGATPVSDGAVHTVSLTIDPQLTIVKTADTTGPVGVGDLITYTYDVTNSGNVTITDISVNDTTNAVNGPVVPGGEVIQNDVAPLSDSIDAASNGAWDSLAPGDTIRFTATYTVTQQDVDTLQ